MQYTDGMYIAYNTTYIPHIYSANHSIYKGVAELMYIVKYLYCSYQGTNCFCYYALQATAEIEIHVWYCDCCFTFYLLRT